MASELLRLLISERFILLIAYTCFGESNSLDFFDGSLGIFGGFSILTLAGTLCGVAYEY